MSTTELQVFDTSTIEIKDELFNKTLESIFPSNAEEQKLLTAREQLKLSPEVYSDEKLSALLADFEYLAAQLLDKFERQQFNGKTLSELLKK